MQSVKLLREIDQHREGACGKWKETSKCQKPDTKSKECRLTVTPSGQTTCIAHRMIPRTFTPWLRLCGHVVCGLFLLLLCFGEVCDLEHVWVGEWASFPVPSFFHLSPSPGSPSLSLGNVQSLGMGCRRWPGGEGNRRHCKNKEKFSRHHCSTGGNVHGESGASTTKPAKM